MSKTFDEIMESMDYFIELERGKRMLSKEECVKLSQSILNALPDHEFINRLDDAVLKLNKQAHLAIELQAMLDAIERCVYGMEEQLIAMDCDNCHTSIKMINDVRKYGVR